MATFSRHVTVDWKGTLMEGGGSVKAGTGAFTLPVSFPRRIGEPEGTTSPEELVAAAHASCFAMVIAATMGKKGASVAACQVTSTVTTDKGEAGLTIISSQLDVAASGVTGMDAATFVTTVTEAEKGCPVSKALRGGSATISVKVAVK